MSIRILYLRDRYFLKPGSNPWEDEGITGVHTRQVYSKIACVLRFVCEIFTSFNVIQGHQFWHQRKPRMLLLCVCIIVLHRFRDVANYWFNFRPQWRDAFL